MVKIFNKYYVAFLSVVFIISASLIQPVKSVNPELRITKALSILGDKDLGHFPDTGEFGVSSERGRHIVHYGFSTRPGGGKTKKQSKHFVCTSCHNVEKEDPDLRFADPEARLSYTMQKGLPFLQASSLYGVVNRETFYNGDYEKKYGKLVNAARNDIRGAIQLCATECAQGRKLKKWELESILAYLWTIDLKLSDLNLEEDQLKYIELALNNKVPQDSAISIIKSRYLRGSPAHFGTAQLSFEKTKNITGQPDKGKMIYENSCLHCHGNRKYSYLLLDDSKMTFRHLSNKARGYSPHSIYQVIRLGVFSKSGKRSYMPQYPLEKMSEQQLKDLESYIELRAK